ncbi:hypothetical protein BDR04DRAFT_1019957, partial [Suillus decipiens]
QLRTGHIPLNKHLHRISLAPSPTYPSCQVHAESVHQSCPKYNRQRHALKADLGLKAHQLKNLLNDDDCMKSLFKFIARTNRLTNIFGDVTPIERENERRQRGG